MDLIILREGNEKVFIDLLKMFNEDSKGKDFISISFKDYKELLELWEFE